MSIQRVPKVSVEDKEPTKISKKPDQEYPIRILKAYLPTTESRFDCNENDSDVASSYIQFNKDQQERRNHIEWAIRVLEEALIDDRGERPEPQIVEI